MYQKSEKCVFVTQNGKVCVWHTYLRNVSTFHFGEKEGVPGLGPGNIILVILKLELKIVRYVYF